MDKKFWDCYCLTDYVQVKTVAVCEKCQALRINQKGYDTIENYKLAHLTEEHGEYNQGNDHSN
jgi:hypothetical protein